MILFFVSYPLLGKKQTFMNYCEFIFKAFKKHFGNMGIYYHEHEVSIDCRALKEAATSLSTRDNLQYNPVLKKLKIFISWTIYNAITSVLEIL